MMHTRRAHTQACLPCVMGCSKSKEQKERSSKVEKKEERETMLSKGLGRTKLDSNIKRYDTGYIASIFSANYNIALRQAPHHIKIDVDELLLPHSLPCTEGSALKKISKFKQGHGRARRSSLSDLMLMQPLLSNDNKEASADQRVGGAAEVDVKASNSSELIKDLDDTQVFLKVGSLSKMHPEAAPSMDPVVKASQTEVPHSVSVLKRAVVGGAAEVDVKASNSSELIKDLDDTGVFLKLGSLSKMHPEAAPSMGPVIKASQTEVPHSVSVLKRAFTLPRAKYLTFFDDTDIDAWVAASKSTASENVCAVCDSSNEAVEPNLHTHQDDGVSFESSGVDTYRQICNESNVEPISLWKATLDTGIHPWRQASSINPHDSQKTPSMKYVLNDNSIENEDSLTLPDSYATFELSMLHGRSHDEDDDEVGFWYGSNCSSCLSSPEFSSAASLKDWLPSEDRPLKLAADFYQAGNQTPVFNSFEATHTFLGPVLFPSTKRVLMKYVGGDSSGSFDDATQDILQSPPQAAEKDGVPTLMMAQRGPLCILK